MTHRVCGLCFYNPHVKNSEDASWFFIDWLLDTFWKLDTLRSAKLRTPNYVTIENSLFTALKATDDAASQVGIQRLL